MFVDVEPAPLPRPGEHPFTSCTDSHRGASCGQGVEWRADLRRGLESLARLLASMAVILSASDGNWCRPGASQTRLRRLIDTLQAFDRASHRPKGVAMLQAMSGRSASCFAVSSYALPRTTT